MTDTPPSKPDDTPTITNEIDRQIGKTLRERREGQKITLDAMAAFLRVKLANVEAFEAGTKRISAAQLYGITDMLGIGLDALFDSLYMPDDRHAYLNSVADSRFIRNYILLPRAAKNDMQDHMRRVLDEVAARESGAE